MFYQFQEMQLQDDHHQDHHHHATTRSSSSSSSSSNYKIIIIKIQVEQVPVYWFETVNARIQEVPEHAVLHFEEMYAIYQWDHFFSPFLSS